MASEQEQENNDTVVTPSPQQAVHPLHGRWTLWFDCRKKQNPAADWSANLQTLYTFGTVEEFWGLHSNIASASELASNSNYHLFREGIQPAWEDPRNAQGGKWVLTIKKNLRGDLNHWWLLVCLSLIGETLEDDICGAVVSVRNKVDRISVWTATARNSEVVGNIGQQLRTLLRASTSAASLEYQSHSDASHSNSSFQNRALHQA
mmetsp:Transcript_13158/g.26133  ORF Transcript_13158/g.26133 Transcript_13158/m.26133 type:complete len:205 (+) Transcript_13158:20-634(+)